MAYIKYFMLAGVLPVLLLYLAGLYIQPVSGDLTRLGNLPERDFGWNAMQQQLLIKESPQIPQPKVVVIGDSFSVRNIWQSIAADHGPFTFLTFDWGIFSNNIDCIEKWLTTVKEKYPSCDFIVIETIERDFLGRFNAKNSRCTDKAKKPIKVQPGWTESERTFDLRSVMPDPIYAVKSMANSLHEFKSIEKKKDVFVAPLNRGDLFSNKKSDLLLFYENDMLKKNWEKDAVRQAVDKAGHIQRLAASHGMTLLFAVMPDKSTAYASYFKYPQFSVPPPDIWAELDRQKIHHVDLRQVLLKAVESNQDLYLPNDTHIGSKGYILTARAITDHLKAFDALANN